MHHKWLVIDHYDSFTGNLVDWLSRIRDIEIDVVAFEELPSLQQIYEKYRAIILSPGPKRPCDAASTVNLVEVLIGKIPILGVCLGHQILGEYAGFKLAQLPDPWHGTRVSIAATEPFSGGLFFDLSGSFSVAQYNSLILLEPSTGIIKSGWKVTARSVNDAFIQAIEYREVSKAPAFGVQFHPESFLSEQCARLRNNWMHEVLSYRLKLANRAFIDALKADDANFF